MQTFNPHDIKKLKAFLEQPSTRADIKNGHIISSNYDPDNPQTWEGIIWSDNGDCFVITWSNKKHLSGKLNLDDCPKLAFIFLENNQITSLSTQNCFNLEEISCKNNRIEELNAAGCYNLHTLNVTANPITAITLIACDKLKHSGMTGGPSS